jgi:N-acetyl sugar amidotransferase
MRDKALILSEHDNGYRRCALTVMDNIADPHISFDGFGICNYYHEFKSVEKTLLQGTEAEKRLSFIKETITARGTGKKYDCLIGLSGGVDSSYVAYLVHKLGLRPLAVHLDNGWNSELAVRNIENITKKLNIDLYTLVVNWNEFRDIQLAYIKAGVVDIEVVSDHAILATMYKLAHQHGISYIISGTNVVTEHIMPPGWIYKKMDFANLKDIHKKYGRVQLKTYPFIDFKRYVFYSAALKLTPISILDYVPYNKREVKAFISRELDWRDYGGKHYESIFTKFYQAYILPEKFRIDKRKPHLSTLICSGQMSREEALRELTVPLYQPEELRREMEYVLKKLGLSEAEFATIMQTPPGRHDQFNSDASMKRFYMRFLERTQRLRKALKS